MNPFGLLSRSLRRIRGALRTSVWRVEGRERAGGAPLEFAYAGLERHKNYFVQMACAEGYRERALGRKWLWNVEEEAARMKDGCPLIVYEVGPDQGRFFAGPAALRIPVWVACVLDLDSPSYHKSMRNGSLSEIRRKTRNRNFRYFATWNESELRRFYDQMYVPYARSAHGGAVFIEGYETLLSKFRRGALILVHQGSSPVGGILVHLAKDMPQIANLGVLEGQESLVPQGLTGAMMYHAIHHLKDQGFGKVNLGYSRAFLKDGALRWKMRMGAGIGAVHRESGYLTYRINDYTPGVRQLLAENPCLSMDGDGLHCARFVEEDEPWNEHTVRELLSDRFCNGAADLHLFSFQSSGTRSFPLPQPWSGRVRIEPASRLLAEPRPGSERVENVAKGDCKAAADLLY